MEDEWPTARLGDLVSIRHGWPFKSELYSFERLGRPIVVSIGNYRYTGGFRFENTAVKEYAGEYPKEYELNAGDLLLVMTCQTPGGEILGIPASVPNDGRVYLHNQRLGLVVLKSGGVCLGYLYWLFLSRDFNRHLVLTATGTKILHTAPTRIESFEFRLPPLPVQRAIAHILGTLDDKIELNRRMNQTLEAMARALFKSWFVDFDPVRAKAAGRQPSGMDAETAALFPSEFEMSEFGEVPRGWRVATWGDIATLEYGKAFREYNQSGGHVPVYGTNGQIGFHTQALCPHAGIVVGRKGAYRGIHFSDVPFYVIDTAFYLQAREDFGWRWAFYELLRFDLNGMDSGSAIPSTSREQFYRIAVCIPPSEIQRRFETQLDALWKRQRTNDAESAGLCAIRDALVPSLLSGDRDVERVLETQA